MPRTRVPAISPTRILTAARHASLWLLAALVWPVVVSAQQQDSPEMKPCKLLTPAELSTAIGGSVTDAHGTFSGKSPQSPGDFWSCDMTVGTRAVRIFYDTLPVTPDGKRLAQERRDRLLKAGYRIQEKELNAARCSTTVPPRSATAALPPPQPLTGTECQREKLPYHIVITVEAIGASDLVPMEKVAPLAEKVASRLP
jgi:hypothetical protein